MIDCCNNNNYNRLTATSDGEMAQLLSFRNDNTGYIPKINLFFKSLSNAGDLSLIRKITRSQNLITRSLDKASGTNLTNLTRNGRSEKKKIINIEKEKNYGKNPQ